MGLFRKISKIATGLIFVISTDVFAEIKIDLPQTEAQLNQLLDKLKNSAYPQIEKIESCLRESSNVVDEYSKIREKYLAKIANGKPLAIEAKSKIFNSEVDLSISSNFEYYLASNTNFFKLVDSYVAEEMKIDSDSSLEDINLHFKNQGKRTQNLADSLYPISQTESQFLSYLDGSKKALLRYFSRNAATITWLIGDECKSAPVKDRLLLLDVDSREFVDSLVRVKDFALAQRLRRTNLVQRIQYISNQRANAIWQEKFTQEASKTREEIETLLKTTKLGSQLEEYWITENMRGLGEGLHLKYLQFQLPLRVLFGELGQLKDFEEKFISLGSSLAENSQYLGKISNYKEVVNNEIKALLAKGWKGQLDRQILLNKKRMENAQGICKEKIDKHLAVAANTKNSQDFSKIEILYAEAIDTCTKK